MSLNLLPVPEYLFDPKTRHVAVFAHQDDETGYLGLMKRIGPNAHAIWMTNGDGLAPFEKADPLEYAARRQKESSDAMHLVGYADSQLEFLGHSEIAIYDDFKDLAQLPPDAAVPEPLRTRLLDRARQIEERIAARVANADVVWALAYQGGHPEHDLCHYLTARAVHAARTAGRNIAFFELPEYEILFFVPLRFAPWKRGDAHVIELSDEELALKEKAMGVYPTQEKIIQAFGKLISLYGAVSALRLKPFTFKSFSRKEYFAPVPADRDYLKSTHKTAHLDYIREEHEGTRIRFDKTVARWIRLLQEV